MDTMEAIRARRNVRNFSDQEVSREDLEVILEAGWRAPSAMNSQRRDFVVVTERALIGELAGLSPWAAYLAGAPAVVALVSPLAQDRRQAELDHFDLGQAAMAMMIAATSLGLGSGHASVTEHERARELLHLPDNVQASYLIALGYPKDRPLRAIRRPARRPFGETVHWDHW
jgi:nitroreductase